jgi:hypothetical protein
VEDIIRAEDDDSEVQLSMDDGGMRLMMARRIVLCTVGAWRGRVDLQAAMQSRVAFGEDSNDVAE